MSLSNDLLSQFVKVNKDNAKPKTETTVYGTTVEYEGKTYVRLDGSDLLTPVESTVATQPDERVTVMIKDHTATITGNLSSPSARKDDVDGLASQISEFEIIVADVVYTDELNAEIARIDQLVAEDALIRGELTAGTARIDELVAKDAEITGKLTANEAEIADLKTGKLDAEIADIKYATVENLNATNADIHNLSATFGDFEQLTAKNFEAVNGTFDSLDTKYANIDFANIGEAAIEKIFADSGLIKDIVVGTGTITGELVGVTIKGDLIEANTLKADALVVKGDDGLYYKLNFESGNFTSAEEVPDDGLHGSVIIAKSITADRIAVTDLVAFGATIGGFIITNNAIHSVVKTSVNNTTRGFYVDNDGQFAVGDSNNFIKYYLDTDGKYKLAISAGSMVLSSRNQSVEDALDDMQNTVDGLDKIEVGGRNLLPLTRTFDDKAFTQNDEYPYTWSSKVIDETYNGCSVRYCESTISGAYFAGWDNVMTTNHGDTYTLSFWAKGSGSFIVTIVNTDGPKVAKVVTSQGVISETANANNRATFTLSENWTRYWATYTFANTGDVTAPRGVLIYQYAGMYMCGVKFEKGNIATDWTPSPEDTAEVDVDGIRNDVINGIEIGGRNLLPLTKTFDDSVFAPDTECMSKIIDETYNGCSVRYAESTGTSGYFAAWLDVMTVNYGDTYTISFWAKGTGTGTAGATIGATTSGSVGVKNVVTSQGNTYTNTRALFTLSENWERYWATYTFADTGDVTIPRHVLILRTAGMYMCGVKLEKGNKATDWTPSPDDAAEVDVDAIVNGIDIGCRNLLKNTRAFLIDNGNSEVAEESYKDFTVRHLQNVDTSSVRFAGWDNAYLVDKNGQKYTLSFYAKGSGALQIANNISFAMDRELVKVVEHVTSQGDVTSGLSSSITLSEGWTRYWVTWTFSDTGELTAQQGFIISLTSGSEAYICGCKLEKGNKATDWTPAPEDGEDAVANAQDTANNAQSAANDAQGRVEVAEATLQILADSISSLVTDENGTSLMTQTADGWTFNLSTVTETINSTSETLNDLSGKVDGVDETINNLNGLVDDLGKKTAYITMTADANGDPCIELGKSDNDFKVRITNTSVDFLEGSSRIAYVSNRSLYIEKAIIKDELQIGEGTGFIWKRRSNGNLGLRWIGG